MFKVSARWVPRMLTEDQKKSRHDISKYLLSLYEDDPEEFMHRFVTQDETLVNHFDLDATKQGMKWKLIGSPTPKKFKRVSSAGKVMASIFWDSQGVIMVDYLAEGHMINGVYYAEELRWLHQEIVNKRRGKLTRGILPLQDNAPAHTSQVAIATMTKCSFKVLPHPPYSQDLAPPDLFVSKSEFWKQ